MDLAVDKQWRVRLAVIDNSAVLAKQIVSVCLLAPRSPAPFLTLTASPTTPFKSIPTPQPLHTHPTPPHLTPPPPQGLDAFESQLADLCKNWLADRVFSVREAAAANLRLPPLPPLRVANLTSKLSETFGSDFARRVVVRCVGDSAGSNNYLLRMTAIIAIKVLKARSHPDLLGGDACRDGRSRGSSVSAPVKTLPRRRPKRPLRRLPRARRRRRVA
jgi:hypothetical protein